MGHSGSQRGDIDHFTTDFASRIKGPNVKLDLLLSAFRKPDDRSGRYRHGERLGRPELLWNRLAVRFQPSYVDRDRLGRAFTTLVDGSALGEASWERGYQNHVAAGFLLTSSSSHSAERSSSAA